MGREYTFFRNLDFQHSTFRLVLYSTAKNVSSKPEDLCLMPLPISQAEKVWQRPLSSHFLPEEAPGVLREPVRLPWSLGWFSVLVCLPRGNCVKGNQAGAKQPEKTSFPWSHAVISGLPPTYPFPPPTLCSPVSEASLCPNSAEEKLINASTRLSLLLHCWPLRRLSDDC